MNEAAVPGGAEHKGCSCRGMASRLLSAGFPQEERCCPAPQSPIGEELEEEACVHVHTSQRAETTLLV